MSLKDINNRIKGAVHWDLTPAGNFQSYEIKNQEDFERIEKEQRARVGYYF